MKTSSQNLRDYLNRTGAYAGWAQNYIKADLYAFDLRDGTELRWNYSDMDLLGYSCSGPTISRSNIRTVAGMEVCSVELTLGVVNNIFIYAVPLQLAAVEGVFDGAAARIYRLFMPTWGDTSLGTISLFEGYVAGVAPSSSEIKLTLHDGKEPLSRKIPRYIYQPACSHALYDAGCGVTKAPVSTTIGVGSTVSSLVVQRTDTTNYWALGTIEFKSGALKGVHRTIESSSGATLSISVQLPSAPVNGVSVELLTGCNKSLDENGCARYSNERRFRGFPFIPKPESIR